MTDEIVNILAWTWGWGETIVLLIIAVLLFGRRLPEIARSLGKSLVEFKKGIKETKDDIDKAIDTDNQEQDKDNQSS